jgi:hypothetical protein
MVFVPEGQHDSSQARSAWVAQGFPWVIPLSGLALTRHMNVRSMNNTRSSGLEMLKGPGTSCQGPEGRAPKGLEDSAQGFNPGNRSPERYALKGRQIERTNNANPIVASLNCAL